MADNKLAWTLIGAVGCASSLYAAQPPPPEPEEMPLFNVPRLTEITVDGDDSDWGDAGFQVGALAALNGADRSASDLKAEFRVGWSDKGLLLVFRIHDDRFIEHEAEDSLWQRDSIEIYLANQRGGKEMVQIVIAPGMTEDQPKPRWHLHDHRTDPELKGSDYVPEIARRRESDTDYTLEVLMPWAGVGIEPTPGREVGLQVMVNDRDREDARLHNSLWYPGVAVFADRNRLHRIQLADETSRALLATGRARYRGLEYTEVKVVGVEELAGRDVYAEGAGNVIARGKLQANGGRALATLLGPIPARGVDVSAVDIYVADRLVARQAMPDLEPVREEAAQKLPFIFSSYCFTGIQFPDGHFADPVTARNVMGPYTVNITYYDHDFQHVTQAATPGRYGAVITIKPEEGDTAHRYVTLFRMPAKMNWRDKKIKAGFELPPEMGFDPGVVAEQQGVMGAYLQQLLRSSLRTAPESARLFAWLYETKPGTITTRRNSPASRDLAWTYELRRRIGLANPYEYIVHEPMAAKNGENGPFPAILALHGSGGRGQPVQAMKHSTKFEYMKEHPELPFYVIAPRCHEHQWWQAPKLDELYDEIMAKYPIDPDRVYMTGESMGGVGSWTYAATQPDRFAAVAPICGFGDPEEAQFLKDIPIWNFHGAKDPAVPIERSEEMVDALREVNARIKYTVFPDGGHGIWPKVYGSDELYEWFLRQRRGKPDQPRYED